MDKGICCSIVCNTKNWGKTLDKNSLNCNSEYRVPHSIKGIRRRRIVCRLASKSLTDTKLNRCVYHGLLRAHKMLIRYYLLSQELSRDEEQ